VDVVGAVAFIAATIASAPSVADETKKMKMTPPR
jgi:hypothetical protein